MLLACSDSSGGLTSLHLLWSPRRGSRKQGSQRPACGNVRFCTDCRGSVGRLFSWSCNQLLKVATSLFLIWEMSSAVTGTSRGKVATQLKEEDSNFGKWEILGICYLSCKLKDYYVGLHVYWEHFKKEVPRRMKSYATQFIRGSSSASNCPSRRSAGRLNSWGRLKEMRESCDSGSQRHGSWTGYLFLATNYLQSHE